MIKNILTASALGALIAGGAFAQTATDPAVDPAADPAASGVEAPADGALVPEAGDTEVMPAPTADAETDTEVMPTADTDMNMDEEWAPVDLATFSTDRLIGADIVTFDDEKVASIEDVIISDDGQVENLVAQFGGFLGFGENKVLLTMDEVEVMEDASETLVIRTQLTPETIETRPDYE